MNDGDSQAPGYVVQATTAYNLSVARILAPQKGYRNQSFPIQLTDDTMVNFILYKNEPGILSKIRNANRVANYTAMHNLPARHTYDRRILQLRGNSAQEIRFGALYTYLPGETIAWEAYTKHHIKLLGSGLSDVHFAIRNLPEVGRLPSVAQEYVQIIRRMQRYFADPLMQEALQQKLAIRLDPMQFNKLYDFVVGCDQLPDQQALHMDFVRSNILFATDSELHISGILDFEKTARGHRAFDIARTLAFLLVDCKYKTADKIYKYFLDSGYNKRGACDFRQTFVIVNGQKYDLLEKLLDLFLVYDFYKFLRHNPYESLNQNEHFVRTRAILQERGLIIQKQL